MASWASVTMTEGGGYVGLRFDISAPRGEFRVDGFAETNGISITTFGTRERRISATCWMTETNRSTIEGKMLSSGTLATDAQGSFSGAVLVACRFGEYFLVGSTQYCRATLEWIA